MMIPCSNPLAQYKAHREAIDAAVSRVLGSGRYILGEEVCRFEEEFAAYVGVRHAVGVGSGTEALHIALRACGVGEGDEVISVSHTAAATVAAIELAGALPVLVDIEPAFYTINPGQLQAALSPRTRAVIAVHLYGLPADVEPIMAFARMHGLAVIEDCAQATGALYRGKRVGSWGDAGCFSFYPTKNLGAIGDGGMVVTRDDGIAEKARLLRQYGWKENAVSRIAGWNSRLDELQAAILRVKLRSLDSDNAARARLASLYARGLDGMELLLPESRRESTHVFHLFVVRSPARDRLINFLKDRGIEARIHYPVPVHLQPAYLGRVRAAGTLGESEKAAREVLSLPMYPELAESDVGKVIEVLEAFHGRAI